MWLHKGRAGNLETAAQMAALVREDAWRDEGLKRYAAQLLINAGLDSHSDPLRILEVIFRHVQAVTYIADPGGEFDAIHSARETLAKGYGDCDDLSVLLATLLAELGFTPSFVLARYKGQRAKSEEQRENGLALTTLPLAEQSGFDHIYVEVPTKRGRIVLDPTSRQHGAGWENPRFIERKVFSIFGNAEDSNPLSNLSQRERGFVGMGLDVAPLATTGAQVGLSFVPVVGPILSALVGPLAGLFNKSAQRAAEQGRDELYKQTVETIHGIEAQAEACQITPQQAAAQARQVLQAFYQQCDAKLGAKIGATCRNFDADAQSYIATMGRNPGCAGGTTAGGRETQGSSGAVGSLSVSGPGGLNVSLPTVLLLLGGAYLLLKN